MLRILALIIVLGVTCHAAEDSFTAGKFWVAFRGAVLSNQESKIISMTKLPLAVHGVSDGTPVKYYGRSEVPRLLHRILMQTEYLPVGNKLVMKTLLGLLYDKKFLTHEDLQAQDHFRFYQLEFEMIKGRWLLTRAYLEE